MSEHRLRFSDNFDQFPVGLFPHDYSPMGEYHCVELEGYRGDWMELTLHHSWRNSPGWLIGEEDGNRFMEHAALRERIPSILAAGDFDWQDYVAKAKVRLLSGQGFAGIALRLQHSQAHYLLSTDRAKALRLEKICFEKRTTLGEYQLPEEFAADDWHEIAAGVRGSSIRCLLDGEPVIAVEDDTFTWGKIGLVATAPARFDEVTVAASSDEVDRLSAVATRRAEELDEVREQYPQPELWRKLSLGDFGASKSVRFGDVDGDGEIEVLMAQNLKRMGSGDFGMVSCLTLLKLNGDLLWQLGEPNPEHALLTADVPVQIHDLDGDGKNEVVLCKDFRIQVLDGATGELKLEAPTPKSRPSHQWLKEDIYSRIFGDSICFADLSGRGRKGELLIKDRYNHLWAYSDRLEPLWCHACETGHYAFPYDVDGDGRDEVFIGSTLLDEGGRPRWSIETDDHVDTISVISLKEGQEPLVLFASGDAGLYALDLEGKIVFHERLGHMQDVAVGKFRDDLEGLQFFTQTFWGYPGIVFLYDADLQRARTTQEYPHGFSTFPVNWSGEPCELIFASPHRVYGGLYDGWGRKVVELPDDGHPNLCYHPLNVTGDARDELLCWDERELWIYTQDQPFEGDQLYAPRRLPLCNFSNYRGEISLPGWVEA